MFKNTIVLFAAVFLMPISAHPNEYRCFWEASRSMSSQVFTPLASPINISGVVRITDDGVTYGSAQFLRARSIPIQKRPNGTNIVVYGDGKQMFTVGYTPDGQVLISLMRDDEEKTQFAGKCR